MREESIDELLTWGGDDPFTHTLIVGPTRCGKTATLIKPLIYQILKAKKNGKKVGMTIIEPKGDIVSMVKEMSDEFGLTDCVYIDPLFPDKTGRINVMKGNKADVAEATVAVLKSLFGKQDAFFATVQELSSRNITLLLKELHGDNMDIIDVVKNLRDENLLKANVERLKQLKGNTDLVQFFEAELLGSLAEKYRQFIIGLRAQLENITSNEYLRPVITGQSSIDIDEHFERGGTLAVNTALGKLGRAGDAFGMFMAMHMQLGTFRRKGTERTRIPHYLIIDEYSRYINPDVERFLSIAAEYRVAGIFAIQSLGQLEVESGMLSSRAMKTAILGSCRNKIIFGGISSADAKEITEEMGVDIKVERTKTYDGGIMQQFLPKTFKDEEKEKERFHYTLLMDGLPRFHFIYKLLKKGTPKVPGIAVGEFIPRDWKEQSRAEDEEDIPIIDLPRPPIWRLKERWEYDVGVHKYFEKQEHRKKAEVIFAEDPFETVRKETGATLKVEQKLVDINEPKPTDNHNKELELNDLNEDSVPVIKFKPRKKLEMEVLELHQDVIEEKIEHKQENPKEFIEPKEEIKSEGPSDNLRKTDNEVPVVQPEPEMEPVKEDSFW